MKADDSRGAAGVLALLGRLCARGTRGAHGPPGPRGAAVSRPSGLLSAVPQVELGIGPALNAEKERNWIGESILGT